MMKSGNAQVVYTSEPLPDELKKMRKGYWICGICCLLGTMESKLMAVGGMGLFFYAIFMVWYTEHLRFALRRKKFLWNPNVDWEQLFYVIQPILTGKYGMQVERSKDGTVKVTHDKLIYDIIINEDNTFSLWWRMTWARAFFTISGNKKGYRKSRTTMGIIVYEIQTALGVNIQHGAEWQSQQ